MRITTFRVWFLTFLWLAAFSAVIAQTPPETVSAPPEKIHFGDLIDIDIIGSTEYDWRGSITPEGYLSGLDFIEEPIFALCKSENEIAAAVAAGYSKLLREPQVSVKILDRSGRPLSLIYGAVKTPQRMRLDRPAKLNEILILSGGLTERAGGEVQILRPLQLNCEAEVKSDIKTSEDQSDGLIKRERFITRKTENGSVTINIRIADLLAGKADSNPEILSGDIVTVLEAAPIYIIGGTNSPLQIAARNQTTVSGAIAAAGGIPKNADGKNVLIYRRAGGETKVINVNLEEIAGGTAEDWRLLPFDTVEIQGKTAKKRKLSPITRQADIARLSAPNLPLRIID